MGVLYLGNAVSTAFAAPIGSYAGGLIGWRGVFWALVLLAAVTPAWQRVSLPSMPSRTTIPPRRVLGLLKRRNVSVAMLGLMLSFGGAFATFTYLRPFLETQVHATLPQLSLMLLGLGAAVLVVAAGALLASHEASSQQDPVMNPSLTVHGAPLAAVPGKPQPFASGLVSLGRIESSLDALKAGGTSKVTIEALK